MKDRDREDITEKLKAMIPQLKKKQIEDLSYIVLGMLYTNELEASYKKEDSFQLDLF